jgi:hypothetical protein
MPPNKLGLSFKRQLRSVSFLSYRKFFGGINDCVGTPESESNQFCV